MSATAAPTPAPGQSAGGNDVQDLANSPSEVAADSVAVAGKTVLADSAAAETEPAAEIGQQVREEAAARLRQRTELPPALRERLAAVVASSLDTPADGQPLLPLEQCLQAIEASLPEFLRQNRADAARPSHPLGEAFFTGKPEEISDARAELLAREQLARSGLLRGQRVRVAD